MTVQQQVANRIINMSDEGAMFINQVINNMNPVFLMLIPQALHRGRWGKTCQKDLVLQKDIWMNVRTLINGTMKLLTYLRGIGYEVVG